MPADLKQLITILDQENQTLRQLQDLTAQEREALAHNQAEQLKQLLEQKEMLLERSFQHARARKAWLEQTGLPPKRFLALLEERAPRVYAKYQEARNSLLLLKKDTAINQNIVARSLGVTQRVLEIVCGKVSAETDVYNRHGETRSSSAGLSLGSA